MGQKCMSTLLKQMKMFPLEYLNQNFCNFHAKTVNLYVNVVTHTYIHKHKNLTKNKKMLNMVDFCPHLIKENEKVKEKTHNFLFF